MQYENDSTIDWTCKINQKDTCMKDLKRKPQLRNCQSRLTLYLTLVKQKLKNVRNFSKT